MPARKDRTGETTIANNGMKMTIIVYRNSHDMDVQFEDGAVRNKVRYNAFKIGNISHPNELRTNFNNTRIGDISVATNGMKMTIIAYRNSRDIDVQFDDGAVKKGVTYLNFIKGKISHPSEKDRTGETTIANNGMKMTIIAYRNSRDIDVQFDDGAVRKGVQYAAFKIGNIRHPKEQERKANLSKARLGNTSIASNGMTMTIVEYNDSTNIIVEFNDECHTRVKTSYSLFKKGYVKNPHFPMLGKDYNNPRKKDRTGETTIANNGMKITIIAYRNSRDIDVQFDDGAVRKGVKYQCFIKGEISHPSEKDRTGETTIANNGIKMTIIAYRNSRDIDVQFEDGAIRKGVKYQDFKNGKIRHPKEQERRTNLCKTRLGETSVATNGMTITIVKYINNQNIIVEFNDEQHTRVKTTYNRFCKGNVKNPHFPMRGKGAYKTFEAQYAYTAPNGSVYFYCKCQECGWKKNLTARELINLNHTCENIEGSEI